MRGHRDNGKEHGDCYFGFKVEGLGFRDITPPIMEHQMLKEMDSRMETWIM